MPLLKFGTLVDDFESPFFAASKTTRAWKVRNCSDLQVTTQTVSEESTCERSQGVNISSRKFICRYYLSQCNVM